MRNNAFGGWVNFYIVFVGLFLIAGMVGTIILTVEEYAYGECALDFCKSRGYGGIIDIGVDMDVSWACYKDVDGFIETSKALSGCGNN